MCGISGFIAKNGNFLPVSEIVKMNNLIRHRGPDGEGYMFLRKEGKLIRAGGPDTTDEIWTSQTEYSPLSNINESIDALVSLAFGHRRLSIIDLTALAHQPMSYDNGRYWIIFNGEIYNYRELNTELEKCGHSFKTKSDTETILAAYKEWGVSCLDKFVGMWAFAILDRNKNEVFLARDRYGIKPLYYYFSKEGDFYFANEIKQFTAIKGWQAVLNPERAYDQLVYSFMDHTDETMFSGVFQLPPGTYLRQSLDNIKPDSRGRISFIKWYNLKSEPFMGSFSEASEIFRLLFERSVKDHLHADVPTGTALSGGLDSSSIACEINKIFLSNGDGNVQKTFSSCSEYEEFNERKWIDIVLGEIKAESSITYPLLEDVFKMTPEIIWHHDEPYGSQSPFLAYNIFRSANNNGIKVLLSGQGADEYLGGYWQFTYSRYAKMATQFRISELLSDIRNMQKIRHISTFEAIANTFTHILPSEFKRKIAAYRSNSDHIKRIVDVKRLNIVPDHPFNSISVGYKTVREISEHQTFYSSLPRYLHWEDRNSMAHSVEARVPFLDHRLVEFSYNLPDDFLKKDGVTKRILRDAMTDLVPEKIRNRKDKMGFSTPEEYWVKKENPALFRKKIEDAIMISDGIIKSDALKYYDRLVNGKVPFDYAYWRIIIFGIWIEKFQIKI